MRGVASARAAISVVNALPLGIGVAIGIEWPARTTAQLDQNRPRRGRASIEPASSATPLVRAAARAALDRFDATGTGRVRLVVRSTIPVARGLKSSSAVSASVALATARALGREPPPVEVARIAAEVGRGTGVSATGAFDDALAGLVPGGVVTDNRRDRPLRGLDIEPDLAVALWVPDHPHPRSPRLLARFRREPTLARQAVDAALAGDWVRAMERNSALVERAMGYRYEKIHDAVRRAGAVASGVSGLGPALAALSPQGGLRAVLNALPREGRRRSVRLFSAPEVAGGGPP